MRRVSQPILRGSARPLAEGYDVALLDLDGVVYLGTQVIATAPPALSSARAAGMRLAFVTNNAARPPEQVAQVLAGMGIPARPAEVVNSAQAAAHHLADRLAPGAAVLVVGTIGLDDALRERGLRPVHSAEDDPAAVVQGYSPDLDWAQLAEGAVAIRRGLPWVATNLDPTVPSPRGPLPGNGSMVAALQHATGRTPIATGKPDPAMHRESVQRSGARRPLVVGDRLDTDIEGANAVGCASLLVLTGVTTPATLLRAGQRLRPSFVAWDLGGLLQPHPQVEASPGGMRCGAWTAQRHTDGSLELARTAASGAAPGPTDDRAQAIDALRSLCAAAWSRTGAVPGVRASDERAQRALHTLDLS